MKILIVDNSIIPVHLYGGTGRVVWSLGKELSLMGHDVTFLVKRGSFCDFAKVLHIDESKSIIEQIPKKDFEVIHFNFSVDNMETLSTPYIITQHGNTNINEKLDKNTVFVSKNHAERHQSLSYVHNGLCWEEYKKPDLNQKRSYFHFLGKAAWRVKNVQGAIDVIKATKSEKLKVLGGVRFNFNMGIRFTFSHKVSFMGMVGGDHKYQLINGSKGLVFPIRWHEPFGLAITESLYYGCPIFGTPYGSLPELVPPEVGFLSYEKNDLTQAVLNWADYSPKVCHEYAKGHFNSHKMAVEYIKKYEIVLSGAPLNSNAPQLKEFQKDKFLKWE